MYRAFNITNCTWKDIPTASGKAIYERDRTTIKSALESFVNNGIVDGSNLSAHWFPTIKADVFISHSHKDEEQAMQCASWLKDTFGLDSFIDSCVWGYADDLLRLIDNAHCYQPESKTYSYEKRNGSTSHVHMMLATALSEMLEAAECVFFINSPNAIKSMDAVDKTQSPWLFFELATMRIIRRRQPERMITEELLENFSRGSIKAASLKVEYTVRLDKLSPLGYEQLNTWMKGYRVSKPKGVHALDLLYQAVPEMA